MARTKYDHKVNSGKDRIVSVFQPHVRPIPRGKIKSKIEFGSKLGFAEKVPGAIYTN